jgi:dsRNA-specific ribonuclease
MNFNDDNIINTEDGLIFNPYNPLNCEITLNDVQSILTTYGVIPKVYNMELYKRAFVHKSYTKKPEIDNLKQNIKIMEKPDNCLPLKTKSNERLEYIGDGILECITKYLLYRRFPKSDEGFLTEKKICIVKNEHIGKIALEMGLNKWLILSQNAEEKKTRTNLKKLGCLFEAFIGALFLDFNKIRIKDEDGWFDNIFITGPGFQMVQIFIENIFEKHIDWVRLIQIDDNYKNIFQVKIQKAFKVTPHYLQMSYNEEGFTMGVFLCIGQSIHTMKIEDAININTLNSFDAVQEYLNNNNGKIFLFLGKGQHRIKCKAEQIACNVALQFLKLDTK